MNAETHGTLPCRAGGRALREQQCFGARSGLPGAGGGPGVPPGMAPGSPGRGQAPPPQPARHSVPVSDPTDRHLCYLVAPCLRPWTVGGLPAGQPHCLPAAVGWTGLPRPSREGAGWEGCLTPQRQAGGLWGARSPDESEEQAQRTPTPASSRRSSPPGQEGEQCVLWSPPPGPGELGLAPRPWGQSQCVRKLCVC